jgi:hypothetical protein
VSAPADRVSYHEMIRNVPMLRKLAGDIAAMLEA